MANKDARQTVLSGLLKKHGHVRASQVVRAAKPKTSPIHDEFEWDDATAGHAYRLTQARHMIRITPVRDDTGVEQRFVHVPAVAEEGPTAATFDAEGFYKPLSVVAAEPDDYERALGELMAQLRAVERSIRQLKKQAGDDAPLCVTLQDTLKVARDTVRLMLQNAA